MGLFRFILFFLAFFLLFRFLGIFFRIKSSGRKQRNHTRRQQSAQQPNSQPESQEDRILEYQKKNFETTDVEDADFEELKKQNTFPKNGFASSIQSKTFFYAKSVIANVKQITGDQKNEIRPKPFFGRFVCSSPCTDFAVH